MQMGTIMELFFIFQIGNLEAQYLMFGRVEEMAIFFPAAGNIN